jgi:hypothetical protein
MILFKIDYHSNFSTIVGIFPIKKEHHFYVDSFWKINILIKVKYLMPIYVIFSLTKEGGLP